MKRKTWKIIRITDRNGNMTNILKGKAATNDIKTTVYMQSNVTLEFAQWSILDLLLFYIFLFNLLLIFEEANITRYIDSNIPHVVCENMN